MIYKLKFYFSKWKFCFQMQTGYWGLKYLLSYKELFFCVARKYCQPFRKKILRKKWKDRQKFYLNLLKEVLRAGDFLELAIFFVDYLYCLWLFYKFYHLTIVKKWSLTLPASKILIHLFLYGYHRPHYQTFRKDLY